MCFRDKDPFEIHTLSRCSHLEVERDVDLAADLAADLSLSSSWSQVLFGHFGHGFSGAQARTGASNVNVPADADAHGARRVPAQNVPRRSMEEGRQGGHGAGADAGGGVSAARAAHPAGAPHSGPGAGAASEGHAERAGGEGPVHHQLSGLALCAAEGCLQAGGGCLC
uniref:Uncharacterized protein n=1 Tax=Ditylum brightwellii TaxID=49249 RepID=A0A7S4RJI5_9STRA